MTKRESNTDAESERLRFLVSFAFDKEGAAPQVFGACQCANVDGVSHWHLRVLRHVPARMRMQHVRSVVLLVGYSSGSKNTPSIQCIPLPHNALHLIFWSFVLLDWLLAPRHSKRFDVDSRSDDSTDDSKS